MDAKIRNERMDERTWAMEIMIRYEKFLDPRMYECADYCTSAGLINEGKDIITAWEEWKERYPTDNPQVNNSYEKIYSNSRRG